MDMSQFDKYRKLGLNISYYRKDKGYTQLKSAVLLDIDRTHMQKIETANMKVSLNVIFKLSDLLNVPVYKFF